MKSKSDALKKSYGDDIVFAGLTHMYIKSCNMVNCDFSNDRMDFALDILISVERIADLLQYDEQTRPDYIRDAFSILADLAGTKAKIVHEMIENWNGTVPFTPSSLRSFLCEYKEMCSHMDSIRGT